MYFAGNKDLINSKESLPQAGSSPPGHTPVTAEQTQHLWRLGRRGKSQANPAGVAPHVVLLTVVPLETPSTRGPVPHLQGCGGFCCMKAAGADTQT